MEGMSRRHLLTAGTTIASGLALGLWRAEAADPSAPRLKIVIAGAHPGDPEAACGGTMARLADLGHEVVALYTTRGEAGIRGKTHAQAATIRTREAEQACKQLGARPVFAGQIDGATEVTSERYDQFGHILKAEQPQLVLTHWPIDSHRDHRATALLVYDAWLNLGRKFGLYYYEVGTGEETQHFRPTHYVSIMTTEARKRAACFVHASQGPAKFYALQKEMHRFRGLEAGCDQAEAFIHHEQSPGIPLPR